MSEERERDGDKTLFQGFPFDDSVLNIIPLQKNSKKPAIPWKEYQHKKFPREQLPLKGNFAVVCGEISDFLWILDHDAPPLFSLFKDIDTRTVKTPRGYHQLFKSKEPVKREIKVLGYPIDILGEGSYAVTPPSVVDGKTYHVINHSPILEATPDEIMKRLSKKERDFENPDFKAKVERFKNRVSISNVISSFLNKEHDAGSYWTSKCPFHNDQNPSFCVYEKSFYCFGCKEHGDVIHFIEQFEQTDFKGAVSKIEAITGIKFDWGKTKGRDVKNKGDDRPQKYSVNTLAGEIMGGHSFKTMSDTKEIYKYSNGIFKKSAELIIEEECQERLGGDVSTYRVNEVLNFIRRATYIERELYNSDKYLINLRNGILNINSLELKPHSSEYLFTMQLPLVYDPDAVCPQIDKFFAEVLHEDDIKVIEEMFGYGLYREYFIQKAIMLTGEGANGKSTLINLYIHFLGKENCSSVPLQNLEKERFATATLYGKLANVCSDLPDCALKESAIFKGLVGGDPIQGEQKFKTPFTFINFAKLIFATNKIPETKDKSEAFFRRWVIINFPNKFEGGKAVPQPKLLGDLTSESELSGLLNLALKGLKRLFDNHQFSDGKSTEEVMEYYEKASNPVYAFINDLCILEKDAFTSGEEIYCEFARYCNSKHIMVVSTRNFNSELRKQGFEETRPKIAGKRVRGWKGIRLRRKGEGDDEEDEGGFF